MKVLPVDKYNRIAENVWKKRVEGWTLGKGGMPTRAMYLFLDDKGKPVDRGFVAFTNNRAILRDTKEEAIEAFNKGITKVTKKNNGKGKDV